MRYIIDRPSEIENMSRPEEFYSRFGQNFEIVERFNSKRQMYLFIYFILFGFSGILVWVKQSFTSLWQPPPKKNKKIKKINKKNKKIK